MEESLGSQYALHIALQTMKERCRHLQSRLSELEEENTALRLKCTKEPRELLLPSNTAKPEVEYLREKVSEVSEQNAQLKSNILMVATENRQLWGRLSKLMQVNSELGNHLSKINETLNQRVPKASPNLIRSETFTHEKPTLKIASKSELECEKDTSLEDISFKIISNIAEGKLELEKQCAQMTELQKDVSFSSVGFAYYGDLDDQEFDELTKHEESLKCLKEVLADNRDKLKELCENAKKIKELFITTKPTETENSDVSKQCSSEDVNGSLDLKSVCPICSKTYKKSSFAQFLRHVENHFIDEDYVDPTENFEFIH